jgi:hypothetical protein
VPQSKVTLVKAIVPRRPLWTNGDGHVTSYLDRLEALEQRVATLEDALDTALRRMGAIQVEFDTLSARRA